MSKALPEAVAGALARPKPQGEILHVRRARPPSIPATAAAAGRHKADSHTLSTHTLQPVSPVRPLAPYVGGKRNLSRRLVALIGAQPHEVYAEPFVGMGGVFFRRDRRPPQEIINDLSGDVACLFRVLQEHYPALMDELKFKLSGRNEFDRLMGQDPDTLTDLRRAARFLYLQSLAFGGKVAGRNFGVSYGRSARFDVTRLGPQLQEVHDRLSGIVIERMEFAAFLTRYDRPTTLFYCDPPYWGSEDYYGKTLFSRDDFETLNAALKALKGRFILSINDVPEIREMFGWADMEAVELTYRLSGRATRAGELIITGGGNGGP